MCDCKQNHLQNTTVEQQRLLKTPWFQAAQTGNVLFIQKNTKKNIGKRYSKNGSPLNSFTSLMIACYFNQNDAVKLLLQCEIDIFTTEEVTLHATGISQTASFRLPSRSNALMIAMLRNSGPCIDTIIQYIYNNNTSIVGRTNAKGISNYMVAVVTNNFIVLQNKYFIENEINICDQNNSPILYSCLFGRQKVLQFFYDMIQLNKMKETLFKQILTRDRRDHNMVDYCDQIVNYQKYNTSVDQKLGCKQIIMALFKQALNYAKDNINIAWWNQLLNAWSVIFEMNGLTMEQFTKLNSNVGKQKLVNFSGRTQLSYNIQELDNGENNDEKIKNLNIINTISLRPSQTLERLGSNSRVSLNVNLSGEVNEIQFNQDNIFNQVMRRQLSLQSVEMAMKTQDQTLDLQDV